MLKKIDVICFECARLRRLKGIMVFTVLLALSWTLACGPLERTERENLIRQEVEKQSSFPTKWNDLKVATASGNIELWAIDYVQGNARRRTMWIVWVGDGRTELYPYPSGSGDESDPFVEECFGPHRPEILGLALPVAIKYIDLLHKLDPQAQ